MTYDDGKINEVLFLFRVNLKDTNWMVGDIKKNKTVFVER